MGLPADGHDVGPTIAVQISRRQVLDRIHQRFPDLKAIIMSGHAPNERAEQALRRGLVWLAKPYTTDELAAAVEHVLHGRDVLR